MSIVRQSASTNANALVSSLAPFTTVNNGGARPLKGISAVEFALLRNGTIVYVESDRDYYKWVPFSTETDDTGTAASLNRFCNPTVNGVSAGRFERLFIYSPDWLLQDFFIDSATGHNENAGTALAPLHDDVELYQRWGPDCSIKTIRKVTYAQAPTTQTNYDVNIFENASLTIQGTFTIVQADVLITAVQAQVRTPGAEVRHAITGATLGAGDVGALAIIISGTAGNIGAYAKVLKDEGGGKVIVSPFGLGDVNAFPGFTQVTPVANVDHIEIVTPTTLLVGAIRIKNFSRTPAAFSVTPPANTVIFDSVTLDGNANFTNFGTGELYNEGLYAQLIRSNLKDIQMNGSSPIANVGTYCNGGGLEGVVYVNSDGLGISQSGILNCSIQINSGGFLSINTDTYFQASGVFPVFGGIVSSGGSSFFDLATGVAPISILDGANYGQFGVVPDWGTNNTGYGIQTDSTSAYVYTTKPSVNGTLGAGRESLIGGTDKLYAAVPYVEGANLAALVLRA